MIFLNNAISAYCSIYKIDMLDRGKLILHYPLFKLHQALENSNSLIKTLAEFICYLFRNHSIENQIRLTSERRVKIAIPFDIYDFASFKEIFLDTAYPIPKEMSEIKIAVDLGGNTGMASLYFLCHFPNLQKLIVVEANPDLIPVIYRNLEAFSEKVVIENVCIGDNSDEFTDFNIASNHRVSKISEIQDPDFKASVKIRNLTLRRLLNSYDLTGADLIKIDIEGAEFTILEDAEIFRRFRFMFIEVHGSAKERTTFVRCIQNLGFRVEKCHSSTFFSFETIFCSRL